MKIITKRQFNKLVGKYEFRSPIMNKLAELKTKQALWVEPNGKPISFSGVSFMVSRARKALERDFVFKRTLDRKSAVILRTK